MTSATVVVARRRWPTPTLASAGAIATRSKGGLFINKEVPVKQGKRRDMQAKASKHASKREHACARVRERVRARTQGVDNKPTLLRDMN